MLKGDAGPGASRQGAGWQETAGVGSTHQAHCITTGAPVALEVFKRGRWCVVAKVTLLGGERILAIAHRNQAGVKDTISVPLVAIEYAERAGCRWLYFRRDQTGRMWRISLAALRRPPAWMAMSDGVAELFVKIDRMQPVPWRRWEFAGAAVRLGEAEPPSSRQLAMFSEVAM